MNVNPAIHDFKNCWKRSVDSGGIFLLSNLIHVVGMTREWWMENTKMGRNNCPFLLFFAVMTFGKNSFWQKFGF